MARLGGARISLTRGEFDAALNKEFRKLPRPVRYDKRTESWSFPMVWEVCVGVREIANRHGAELDIDRNLAAWARKEKARVDSIPDVQSMDREDLPVLAIEQPKTHAALRSFQTVGAKFIATNRHCLLADEPGLGKTLAVIAAMIEAQVTGPILVVGPKAAVAQTWPAEIRRWATPNDHFTVIGPDMKPAERSLNVQRAMSDYYSQGERTWVLVGPNYLRQRAVIDKATGRQKMEKGRKVIEYVRETVPELFDVEWSAIVVDESHQTLAGATGNVKKQSAQRQGLGALKLKRNGYRVAMSGTPFRGRPEHLWGQLNWLRPDEYRSYWKWVERHFVTMSDGFGMIVGDIKSEARFYEEARSVMLRRTKVEVAPEMPPVLYGGEFLDAGDDMSPVAVWLDMTKIQKRQYDSMVKDAIAKVRGGVVMANGTFAEMTRLRQLSCAAGKMVGETFYPRLPSNKFDWLVEFLDERGIDSLSPDADTPKIIVASQFTKLLNLFSAELLKRHHIASHLYTGETSAKVRDTIKDDWQENPNSSTRVLFLNLASGGTSLTLDKYSDDIVTLDEPWNLDDEEQVINRIHRLSRIHQVNVWRLRSRNSVEEGIARNTYGQNQTVRSIMDGERGIDYFMKILGMQ